MLPKGFINSLSHKVSYASMIIGPVIYGFIPNEVKTNCHIYDHSIITSGKIFFCLRFSNTSHV